MSSRAILHCTRFFFLDPSNGAAVANRALMQRMSHIGFNVEALCGPVVDAGAKIEPLSLLSEIDPGCTLVGCERSGSVVTVGTPGIHLTEPPHIRAIAGNVPVNALNRTLRLNSRSSDDEAEEFLLLFDATVARLRPDVLVTYGGDPLTLGILSRARAAGIATVFTLHNFGYPNPSHFKDVDSVLVPSEYSAKHHREILGIDCTAIPCPVDPGRVKVDEYDPHYVTFVNPSTDKGVYVFARIADELGRRRPDIPLLVVESRGDESNLVGCGIDLREHGNIFLMSQTPDPRDFWKVTRVCLMPSLWRESQGLVAVEAMMNGIPVITSDRGALPETLGESGILIRIPGRLTPFTRELPTTEEIRPWVDAIIRLWDDSDFYAQHRQLGLKESRRWSPEVLEPQYARFFNEVRSRDHTSVGYSEPASGLVANACPAAKPSIEDGLRVIERRWPEFYNDCDDDPIFVLSSGWRSGSTMLQRLIVHRCFLWGEPFGHAGLIDSLADHLRCFTDRWPESHHFYRGGDAVALSQTFIANLYPSVQALLHAHQGFFERLFAIPARQAGACRWGFKEVRLSVDHALYLKWLYPNAKFLFLIRNPYDAWRSYAARAAKGWKWFNRWPDQPLTVHSFAAHWNRLVTSFINDHPKVNGLVVRYEDLKQGDYSAIEDYLGFPLCQDAGRANPSDGGPPPLAELSDYDRLAMNEGLGALAASLGYATQAEDRPTTTLASIPKLEASVDRQPSKASPNARSQRLPSDPAKCVILVPVAHHIEPACEDALRTLEWRGYTVRRVRGYSAIDQGRNQIASDALRDGFEELLWIDSDIGFEPDAVERLRSHGLPIACGVYPKKAKRSFALNFSAGTKQVSFGSGGGLIEIPYAGAGFLHTRREVYHAVQQRFRLPACNERFGPSMIPFFQPLVIPDGAGHWYLAEDYSFCHRARECGYRIMADTTIRLTHIGSYHYGWEDAGGERPRHGDYTFHIME